MKKFLILIVLSLIYWQSYAFKASKLEKTIKSSINVIEDSVWICVSKTAHKYHPSLNSRGLSRCTHQIIKVSKKEAERRGYTPSYDYIQR